MAIMRHASCNVGWARAAAGLTLACAIVLSACTTSPEKESVKKTLKQTTPERQTIASVALDQLGDAYGQHMAGPDQFDDTGLAYYAYRQNGRSLPRSLTDQLDAGKPIALSDAQPGDLVFFRTDTADGQGQLTVGILIDTHLAVIALPGSQAKGGGVRRAALNGKYWSQRLVGVVRLLRQADSSAGDTTS